MIGLVIFFISIAIIIAIYAFFGTVILSIGFVRNFLCNIRFIDSLLLFGILTLSIKNHLNIIVSALIAALISIGFYHALQHKAVFYGSIVVFSPAWAYAASLIYDSVSNNGKFFWLVFGVSLPIVAFIHFYQRNFSYGSDDDYYTAEDYRNAICPYSYEQFIAMSDDKYKR